MSKPKFFTSQHIDPSNGSRIPVEVTEDQAADLCLTLKQLIKICNAIEEVTCHSGCDDRMIRELGLLMMRGIITGYRYEQGDKDVTFALTGYGHELCNLLYGPGMMPPYDVNNGNTQRHH